MTQWSVRQLLALFLAVVLTLSMSQSVVQASDVLSTMADMASAKDAKTPTLTTTIMNNSGHDGCSDWTDHGQGSAKAIACGIYCVAPVLAMLPKTSFTSFPQAAIVVAQLHLALRGVAFAPEPYPPRSSDLD
jgi:hypothetical protein